MNATRRQLERALLAVCQQIDPAGFMAIAQAALEDAREQEPELPAFRVTVSAHGVLVGADGRWEEMPR